MGCTQLSPTTPYPGSAALLPVLGAALVIGAGCAAPARGCGRVLELRPMQAIGRVSYSWYLWHWPILLVALWSVAPVLGHNLWLGLAAVLISGGLRSSPDASSRIRCDSPSPFAARRCAVSRSVAQRQRSRSVWAWRCCRYGCRRRSAADRQLRR